MNSATLHKAYEALLGLLLDLSIVSLGSVALLVSRLRRSELSLVGIGPDGCDLVAVMLGPAQGLIELVNGPVDVFDGLAAMAADIMASLLSVPPGLVQQLQGSADLMVLSNTVGRLALLLVPGP
jgi:hypothetical protein